jgi:oligosaccharide repeat unit polymerase
LSLIFLALNLFAQGFSLRDLFFDLYTSAAAYANLRFSEDLNVGIFERLSLVFAYLGAILGGFLLPCMLTRNGQRLIVALAFLPSALVAVTQAAKWHLLLCVVFFYAGLLACRASVGTLCLIDKGRIKSVTLYVAVLIAVVTVSFLGRGLYTIDDSGELTNSLVRYYSSYSFGHIYAFSDWFAFFIGRHSELAYARESATYGFYTFAVVFRLLGSDKVLPIGMFDEYTYGSLLTTNVYTMFRGLIQDFGIIGSVLFMLATGLLLHWSFHNMLCKRRPVFTVAVFVLMMGYFYASFVSSMLGVNRIYYVTFILLWIILQINKLLIYRECKKLARLSSPVGVAA